ncbi:MAG: hypothetical protein J6T10_22050 [Methanobrevibacter sp.]|nr:hypothetical protein [Methanobrevibacter sp.]
MTILYNLEFDEYKISSGSRTFRISFSNISFRYILEEIEPPCNDLLYIRDFLRLGTALEYLLSYEKGDLL